MKHTIVMAVKSLPDVGIYKVASLIKLGFGAAETTNTGQDARKGIIVALEPYTKFPGRIFRPYFAIIV